MRTVDFAHAAAPQPRHDPVVTNVPSDQTSIRRLDTGWDDSRHHRSGWLFDEGLRCASEPEQRLELDA